MKAKVVLLIEEEGHVDRPDLGAGATFKSSTTFFVVATSLPDDGKDYVARTPFFVGPNNYVHQVDHPGDVGIGAEFKTSVLDFKELLPEDEVPTQAFHLFRWGDA